MQRSAVSDLGLHCLHMPYIIDTRPKWVKGFRWFWVLGTFTVILPMLEII